MGTPPALQHALVAHRSDERSAEVASDEARASRPPRRSEAVPAAAEIFDFHPPGAQPGTWREPFVVSYTEGPLNAYRLRTLADLRALRDHRYDLTPPSAVAAR